jgi:phospholipase C
VPPSAAPIPLADQAAGNQDGLRGFRVPCLIVSPFARRAFVSSTVFDHTSILRLIEWRWGLEPLTERDATAANIAEVLDFKARHQPPPLFPVPPGPFGAACLPAIAPMLTSTTAETESWANVRDIARIFGWPV